MLCVLSNSTNLDSFESKLVEHPGLELVEQPGLELVEQPGLELVEQLGRLTFVLGQTFLTHEFYYLKMSQRNPQQLPPSFSIHLRVLLLEYRHHCLLHI
jgi:hypothetical protein